MVLEKDIKDLLNHLLNHEMAQLDLNGSKITVEASHGAGRLSLSTPVYHGDNYVPPSVRLCLKPEYTGPASHIRTNLSLDEENYLISLHHMSSLQAIDNRNFVRLLEEFSWIAEEWRQILDDNDRRDLVHVRMP